LADPDWVKKADQGRDDEINTCIACNQACLDHVFRNQRSSCLVNPLACRETEITVRQASQPRRVAVVGAGPAGLSCATTAAARGHDVTLIEGADTIGGQFNMAKRIPGKEEFEETLRYFRRQLELTGVKLELGQRAEAETLRQGGYDVVVLATGVHPREVRLPGIDHPMVLSYVDVLKGGAKVGQSVAIIGAGGIGFDVAEFLVHEGPSAPLEPQAFFAEWGVDPKHASPGAIVDPTISPPARRIALCQRREGKLGANLGKTTGWIHRIALNKRGVEMLASCTYQRIDDEGLHVSVAGEPRILEVENVIICAGQVSADELAAPLRGGSFTVHTIGGADEAGELDAKRAIAQGVQVAISI
jgi:2,4-dienoyl-CoA reductase (NADPH2)